MKRNKTMDILRGLGILFVVLGHCIEKPIIKNFIYSFHLPFFFILAGYLYKEENQKEPGKYIIKKGKMYIGYYVVYNTILVALHNIFLSLQIIEAPLYYPANYVYGFLNSFLMTSLEPFSAAMWFLPVMLVSMILFHLILCYQKDKKNQILIILLLSIVGIYITQKNMNLGLHYQTSLTVLPFLYIGYLWKQYDKKRKPNLGIGLLCLAITIGQCIYIPNTVELSMNEIGNLFLFYTIPLAMTYFLYTISYYINQETKHL